jgi:glycine cleavage system regulatory protein
MASFVLTVLGDDRPGLVSELSAPIKAHGASWERSQLSHLAGKFAGIVLVSVPAKELEGLVADLVALGKHGLHIVVERTDQPAERASVRFSLELLGADHPGIVAEISAALAAQGVSIEELTTDVREAPMAGGTIFEARAVLVAPAGTRAEELRPMLEALAHALMVEIELSTD